MTGLRTGAAQRTKNAPLLLIDAGNSRLKWALLLADGQRVSGGPVDRSLSPEAEMQLHEAWNNLPAPHAIWMSNVAGDAVAQRVGALLALQWPGVPLHRIRAQASQCGVTNHYLEPGKLGSDRWAGLIGAHAAYPGEALLIATLGTATTTDALTADGQFLGGMIAPGWSLMMRSLGEHTAQLPIVSAGDASRLLDERHAKQTKQAHADAQASAPGTAADTHHNVFANTTVDALVEGCRAAQAGLIVAAWHRLGEQLNGPVRCIVAGGAAADITRVLPMPVTRHDDLVLDGLALIARDAMPVER